MGSAKPRTSSCVMIYLSPCDCIANKASMMGFSREYSDEVIRSYALFFGYEGRPIFEDQYANEIPFPKDPYLASVCITSTGGQYSDKDQIWAKRDFQYLWPRIKNLDTYLRMTPADSFFKILWRDRRNSYGWYTLVYVTIFIHFDDHY